MSNPIILGSSERRECFHTRVLEAPAPIVFYIYGDIEGPEEYVDMIHTLIHSPEDQDIIIRIASDGGSMTGSLAIANAVKSSVAQVTTIIDSNASSGGAMIWMSSKNRMIASEHIYLMVHQASWASADTSSGHTRTSQVMSDLMNRYLLDHHGGLLTEEEIADFHRGLDVFLTGTQIIERIGDDGGNEEPASAD